MSQGVHGEQRGGHGRIAEIVGEETADEGGDTIGLDPAMDEIVPKLSLERYSSKSIAVARLGRQ